MTKRQERLLMLVAAAIGSFLTFLVFAPWYIVRPGYSGIHTRMGKIVEVYTQPGMYWRVPFIDSIDFVDMRIQKSIITTEAFSHDLQIIDLELAINHRIADALSVYTNIGMEYGNRIINPYTQETVKAIIAQFTAEELTQKREMAKELARENLTQSLKGVDIQLVDFNFIHVDFHDDFIKSVESKQIAEQRAKQARFETERTKEEAKQHNIRADTSAYAVRVQAEADAYGLELQRASLTPDLCLFKAISKWNGILPQTVGTDITTWIQGKK